MLNGNENATDTQVVLCGLWKGLDGMTQQGTVDGQHNKQS